MRPRHPITPVLLLSTFLGACGSCDDPPLETPDTAPATTTTTTTEPPAAHNPLYLAPEDIDFQGNQRLLERLRGSAHGYFRFVNVMFSDQLCARFADDVQGLPSVNLHDDAHIEQYAVTDLGRGLTDYDDSSTGPGFLDLVRFGTSLRLTCEERGWGRDEQSILDEFLRGYREALDDPELEVDEPLLATQIRSAFTRDRTEFLAWADEITTELTADERRRFELATREYVAAMVEQHAELPRGFFTAKMIGTHPLGIGSALDRKYLIRIEGPTADPLDDIVLEAKEVRDLSGIRCIGHTQNLDPFRVLVGQARIAYRPYPYLGYATIDGQTFWLHGWADNYHEMELTEIESPEILRAIAYDVGVQLGRGHVNQIAAPLDAQLRRAQKTFLRDHAEHLHEAIIDMTQMVTAAHARFAEASAGMTLAEPEDE
jgi:hypothetical protein